MNSFIKAIMKPRMVLWVLLDFTAMLWSDKFYLQVKYWILMGKRLNLKNPKTFNEKLQWLKLYDRDPLYTVMVDKVRVKEYVANILGEEYVIPTLGVWERAEDVDFDLLPNKFVIKCNHNSGTGMYICKDKAHMDTDAVRAELRKGLEQNYFAYNREWPYKNVPRRILAEEFLQEDGCDGAIVDYKFTCFNGRAENVMLCLGRETGNPKFYFFDRKWNLLRCNILGKAASEGFTLQKPPKIDEMFRIADKLSEGRPYLRVDLYCVNGKIYFGELTFFPDSGMDPNLLPETDKAFGEAIILPKQKTK